MSTPRTAAASAAPPSGWAIWGRSSASASASSFSSPGGDYQTIFRLTAVGFFLLALPCFLWVKEPPRTVERLAPFALARGAIQDIVDTARRARSYPELVRFLVGRAFYAEAANTIGIFMAVYLTVQLGFSSGAEGSPAPGRDPGRRWRGVLLGPRRRPHRPARQPDAGARDLVDGAGA